MANYELSGEAESDLSNIYGYSYRQFGRVQADTYFLSIHDCLGRLAESPDIGRSIAHLRAGYFRFEHESHVIFYVKADRGIRVVRILHQRMDPGRNL